MHIHIIFIPPPFFLIPLYFYYKHANMFICFPPLYHIRKQHNLSFDPLWIFFFFNMGTNCNLASFFCMWLSIFSALLIEQAFFSPLCVFLFHWPESVCCQYHTVLITIPPLYYLLSGIVISLALFYFLRIALTIQGLQWFHINLMPM